MSARLFFSYSHKDEALRDQLEVHLAMLKKQGLIDTWHDRRISAGEHLDESIKIEIEKADVVLLLLSADFLASDYCYEIEAALALSKHRSGHGRAISVILRPCDWVNTPLKDYLATPKDGLPVTKWPDIDEAFLDVTKSIRLAIEQITKHQDQKTEQEPVGILAYRPSQATLPRSSNLRISKKFTQVEKDKYLIEVFEFINRFFQGSLNELQERNDDLETLYRKIDENSFTATIYKNGSKITSCSIRLRGMVSNGISYSDGDEVPRNTYNDSMSVECDDQKLFMQPIGMNRMYAGNFSRSGSLSRDGAAEYFWASLIEPLQGS